MKRTIFHVAIAVSLGLAIIISTVWILGIRKSYSLYSTPWKSAPGTYYHIWTLNGEVGFDRDDHYFDLKSSRNNIEIHEVSFWSIIIITDRCYDGVDAGGAISAYRVHTMRVLCLPLLLGSLVLPTVAFFRFLHNLRHRHSDPSLCPRCHYDLRAHQPGQKCPECGAPIHSTPNPQTIDSE